MMIIFYFLHCIVSSVYFDAKEEHTATVPRVNLCGWDAHHFRNNWNILILQASLSKCHSKWWGMRKKPLPPYMIFCEPTGIRDGKKGWWSRWMKLHVVWQRGIVRYKPDAFILYPDGGIKSLSNTDTSLPDYMAWHNKECNFCQTVNSHKIRYFTSIMFIISSGQSSQGVCHVSIQIVFVVRIPKVSIWTPAPSSAIWLMDVVFCSQ
jgi:hypothetical protein